MQWYQLALILAAAFALWQVRGPLPRGWASLLSFFDQPIRRATFVLLANCVAVTIAFNVAGNNSALLFTGLVDGLSAWLIMRDPAEREQGYIGLTFAFQIGCHITAAAMVDGGIPFNLIEPSYFRLINYAFLVQIGILLAWSEDYGGRLGYLVDRGVRHIFYRQARGEAL